MRPTNQASHAANAPPATRNSNFLLAGTLVASLHTDVVDWNAGVPPATASNGLQDLFAHVLTKIELIVPILIRNLRQKPLERYFRLFGGTN